MIEYFIKQFSMSREEAEFYIAQRETALQESTEFVIAEYKAVKTKIPEVPQAKPAVKSKPGTKKVTADEDAKELKRYLTILQELLQDEKNKTLQRHIQEEMADVQELINVNS
jgi:hypothetical protein